MPPIRELHYLQYLPGELYQFVVVYLDDYTLFHLALVCRWSLFFLRSLHRLWQTRYRQRFNLHQKQESEWLRWCLLGRPKSQNSEPLPWFTVYCLRMLVEQNLRQNRYQVYQQAVNLPTTSSPNSLNFLLMNTIRRWPPDTDSAAMSHGSSDIQMRAITMETSTPHITRTVHEYRVRGHRTDNYLVFFQPIDCMLQVESIRRSLRMLVPYPKPSTPPSALGTSSGDGMEHTSRATSEFKSVRLASHGPWLHIRLFDQTSEVCYSSRFYHLERHRWSMDFGNSLSKYLMDSEDILLWHSTTDSILFVRYYWEAVKTDQPLVFRFQIWCYRLDGGHPHCLLSTTLASRFKSVGYGHATRTLMYKVDKERLLVHNRGVRCSELFLYRPYRRAQLASVSEPSRVHEEAAGVDWHIELERHIHRKSLCITARNIFLTDTRDRLYRYRLATGELVSVITLNLLLKRPILSGIYLAEPRYSAHKYIAYAHGSTRKTNKINTENAHIGFFSSWDWRWTSDIQDRALKLVDFGCPVPARNSPSSATHSKI